MLSASVYIGSSNIRVVPDVVCSAEDHASFTVAGGSDITQLSLTARALEAARVPVAIHGEEQEAVSDATPTARARSGHTRSACNLAVHHSYGCESQMKSQHVLTLIWQ